MSFQESLSSQRDGFRMHSDSGASRHFIDDRLMAGVKRRMKNYVALKPPVIITTAGDNKLEGVAQCVLQVDVSDSKGTCPYLSLSCLVLINTCFQLAPRLKRA